MMKAWRLHRTQGGTPEANIFCSFSALAWVSTVTSMTTVSLVELLWRRISNCRGRWPVPHTSPYSFLVYRPDHALGDVVATSH